MQGVPFNVALSTASLSHSKPPFTAAPHDSCRAHVPDKMGILFFNTAELRSKTKYINLLKLTFYVMHQQFNIQHLYALPTLHLCVLYLSENRQRLVPLTA
jgi:hypothetical protein